MQILTTLRSGPRAAGRTLAAGAWSAFWDRGVRGMLRGPYTLHVPSGRRTFTPWFDPKIGSDFWVAYGAARGSGDYTASSESSYLLYEFCRSALLVDGAIAECGVYKGGTAYLLSVLIERSGRQRDFHLFDTFAGVPQSAVPSRDFHSAGALAASLQEVQQRLAPFPFVHIHPGEIPVTLAEVDGVDTYAFVYVNVDIYDATLRCLQWFWPRMAVGGVMVIGDYGAYRYRFAARAAVDDYFNDKREKPIVLPPGSAVLIKR